MEASGHRPIIMSAPSFDPPAERSVTISDILYFFRRQWLTIGGTAAAAGLITSVFLLTRPPVYVASATLVVVPLAFKSELSASALPVQGYQRLLESDAVVAGTASRLRAGGALDDDGDLRLGPNLETRIFVSRRAEETTLAPVIEAVGYADTPEHAALMVNTWVDVFLDQISLLFNDGLSPTLDLIESQYQKERHQLQTLEDRLIQVTDEQEQRINSAMRTWDRRIGEANNETKDLLASYNTDTRRLMVEAAGAEGLEVLHADGGGGDDALARQLSQILSLRTELAQTARLNVLERAITDDSLWQVMISRPVGTGDLEPALNQTLRDEQVNPVYDELTLRLSALEMDRPSLSAAERQKFQAFTAALEAVQSERNTGLLKLISDRTLAIENMERQRALEVEALRRERDLVTNRLRRDISSQSDLYRKLAANYNEVTLAKAEQSGLDVRMGAPAVAPRRQERQIALKGLVAAVLGGIFGLLGAGVREWAGSVRPSPTGVARA